MKPPLQRLALLSFCLLIFGFSKAQPCIDNMAGIYPCQYVDQLSYIDLTVFQATTGNDVWGWTSPTTGREYALYGVRNKTVFVDVTSPEFPLYIGFIPTTTDGSLWRDVKVIGHYAYIVSEAANHGLQIFDLNRLEYQEGQQVPMQFEVDAFYGGFGNCHNIVADTANHFVYAVGTSTFGGGPHIVDVSNPLSPTYAGSSEQAGYTHDAQVFDYSGPDPDYQGRQICMGYNGDFVAIYDVTDKEDVEVISVTPYENLGYVHQGWITEDQRYALSNDETDELEFGITTRTIVWDLADLDNPLVLGYIDLGTNSIDHNLYIRGDMVYESNYTSGLRILDLIDLLDNGQAHLEPFGYFDVFPDADINEFTGAWSNYPYFESGVVAVSAMTSGLHIVRPNFFQLQSEVLQVCNQNFAQLPFSVNRRYVGQINYSVVMDDFPAPVPQLNFATSIGSPSSNAVVFTNLTGLADGYYSGNVIIDYPGGQEIMPFALVKDNSNTLAAPAIVSPMGETFATQLVPFTIDDPQSAYFIFEAALDANFDQIVYQETFFNNGNTFQAWMPFQSTSYFWRIRKPSACGDDLVSPTGTFTIGLVSSVASASAKPSWSVYPNPAIDQVTVSGLPADRVAINAYDLSGRLMKQWQSTGSPSFQADMSELASGVYLVKVDGLAGALKLMVRK